MEEDRVPIMAANDPLCSPTAADLLLEITSPQSCVDTSTRDRHIVQQELEKKLRARADRDHLIQKNILPDFSSSPILFQQTKELQKKKNADSLQKKLRNRPERHDLMQMNILPVDLVDPGLASKQMMLKKNKLADELNRKIARRPGPLELIKGRILAPDNRELSEMVPDVMRMFEQEGAGKTSPSERHRELYHQGSSSLMSPQGEGSPPSKDSLSSPLSDTSVQPQSPEEMTSPFGGRTIVPSPPFNVPPLIPPSPMQIHPAAQTSGIVAASRKSLSPSQARKKQQKQKYRKLRYHEYVPPSKNNGKGGKTNPKPHPKQETPYSHVLQQQQLFLQLQVLQQQYPNGVLMQKLPDIVDSLSKTGKPAKGKETSPSGASGTSGGGANNGPPPSVPQIVIVEQPNHYQVTSIRFEELKVSDLKAACKEMGMIVSGKKAELVERLIEHNNGFLPAIALPENQTRDSQRGGPPSVRSVHSSMVDPQVSLTGFSPPSPTSSSPVFKFPGDQNANQTSCEGSSGVSCGRKTSLPSLSSMGMPQVIPAHTIQQQFDELVERQKRSYICQGQSTKSLAPRPELGDVVAIKFPCPVETQPRGSGGVGVRTAETPQQHQQRSSTKGTTLPRQGSGGSNPAESKMALSPFGKQSHSLPSSPQPLSPSNSTSQLIGEIMDESSEQPRSLQIHPSSGIKGEGLGQSQLNCHAFVNQPCSSAAVSTSNGLPFSGIYSQTNPHASLMSTSSFYTSQQQNSGRGVGNTKPLLRQTQSISSVPVRGGGVAMLPPKTHMGNPPPYMGSGPGHMQRSMSLTNPFQHAIHQPRVHSGASFSSETGEIMTAQDGLYFQDVPMDTQDGVPPHDLSEIFSILEGEPTGFALPGQPPSYSGKPGHRQDSLRSDSVMLAGGLSYQTPNPPLSLMHKSNSDICLSESAHKQQHGGMNPPPYSGAMLGGGGGRGGGGGGGIGWLDSADVGGGGGGGMMSDLTTGSLSLNSSNPGSLTHEGFQMNFLDDLHNSKLNTAGNPSVNGFSQGDYLTHSLPTSISLPFQQDESQALIELGLSSS